MNRNSVEDDMIDAFRYLANSLYEDMRPATWEEIQQTKMIGLSAMMNWPGSPSAGATQGGLSSTPTQQVWAYPDGSQSLTKPKDGEIYTIYDSFGIVFKQFQWSDAKDCWEEINPTLYTITNTIGPITVTAGNNTVYVNGKFLDAGASITIEERKRVCECGAEKIGSNQHSSWCQKWSDNS
jgi:hypothetical protein